MPWHSIKYVAQVSILEDYSAKLATRCEELELVVVQCEGSVEKLEFQTKQSQIMQEQVCTLEAERTQALQ